MMTFSYICNFHNIMTQMLFYLQHTVKLRVFRYTVMPELFFNEST